MDAARFVTAPSDEGRVLSVVASSERYVALVVRAAHDALSFGEVRAGVPSWHGVEAITHSVVTPDRDAPYEAFPPPDRPDERVRLVVCALGEGFRDSGAITWSARRAQMFDWPLLYLLESDRVAVPTGWPERPTVVTTDAATIGEAIRILVLSVGARGRDAHLYLPDAEIALAPDTDTGEIETSLRIVRSQLVERIQRDPRLMHTLSPRAFEELVAELLAGRGYDVTLTPISRDGGRDILALNRRDLGRFLVYVECKKWHPERLVGPDVVRALHGVVAADNVTAGVVATTSSFTPGARAFERQVHHRLALRDFFDLSVWLREHRSASD